MSLEALKQLIEEGKRGTQEYDEFLEKVIKPKLTDLGESHYERLHFFNLGYLAALENLSDFIEKKNDCT